MGKAGDEGGVGRTIIGRDRVSSADAPVTPAPEDVYTAAANPGSVPGGRALSPHEPTMKNTIPRRTATALAVTLALALAACATDDPNRRTKIGAGVGAVTGAVIGNQVGGQKARLIGAAVGALAGGAVGRYQDKQQAALEAALEEELRDQQVDVERLPDDVLLVRLADDASFGFDSDQVRSAFRPTLDKLAAETSTYDKTVLHVVGYTDSTGAAAYNQDLSRRRAASVARYLRDDGVMAERLQIEGRGQSEPRASNDSAAGRARNRRVEIYIKPIVEGQEERALAPPS